MSYVEIERTEVILNKQTIDWNEGADLEEEADA